MVLLYIALGGAVGALARYGLSGWVQSRAGSGFPVGTLVVNVVGCLLLGFSLRYLDTVEVGPELRTLVGVGILGAFTTFSTYSYETVMLLEQGEWGRGAGYACGSVVMGLAAVYVGMTLSGYLVQGRP